MDQIATQAPKKRIEYIDALRGFTMILVVYHHITQRTFNSDGTFINELLVSFQMPLFFFISGFIGYRENIVWNRQTWWVMSRKKLLIQLFPTFVFGLIFAYTCRHTDFKVFLFENYKAGYWFTIVLLEMFLLLYTTNFLFFFQLKKFKKRVFIALLVLSIISFFAIFLPRIIPSLDNCFKVFSLYQTFTYFPYFAFGYICSMNKDVFGKILENKYFTAAIIVTFALFFYVDLYYLKPYAGSGLSKSITLLDIIFNRIIGFLGLLIVYNTFRVYQDSFTTNKKIGRTLQYIGKRTLDIYLLHYFFLPSLPCVGEILLRGNNSALELTIGGGLSLIVVGLCLVVSNVLRTSPILAKYLFGVKPTTNC